MMIMLKLTMNHCILEQLNTALLSFCKSHYDENITQMLEM